MSNAPGEPPRTATEPPARSAALAILLNPWLNLPRPARATQRMIRASPAVFWFTFILWSMFFGAVANGLGVWHNTLSVATWTRVDVGTAVSMASWQKPELLERSLAEAWTHWWAANGALGVAFVVLAPAVLAACATIAAWLQLPIVHVGGALRGSFARAFHSVVAGIGLLTVLLATVGAAIVSAFHWDWQRLALVATPPWRNEIIDPTALAIVCFFAGWSLLLFWLTCAARAAGDAEARTAPGPRCEGCGYDLTHRPDHGRCPECGLSLEASLNLEARRPRRGWERGDGIARWLSDSVQILVRGERFYQSLQTRRPLRASAAFARWHLVAVGMGAATWLVTMLLGHQKSSSHLVTAVSISLFAAPLMGWATHRFVAAAVTTAWFARQGLAGSAVAGLVLTYESAFLWVFCLANGLLLTSYWLFGDWLTSLLGRQFWNTLLGGPTEPIAVLFVNAALILTWMLRFHRCLRSVRFANF
ncbi:MAG: hypothetical protein HY763_12355 [Planctomycetes bacterium]|nr:hypothetical protein [Planctomycetota bacterium]